MDFYSDPDCTLKTSMSRSYCTVNNSPFKNVSSYIDATLRLNKIVLDCNEGKEWGNPFYRMRMDEGRVCVNRYARNNHEGQPWYTFKSEGDAEWSMKEHKDMWEIHFKGLTELA